MTASLLHDFQERGMNDCNERSVPCLACDKWSVNTKVFSKGLQLTDQKSFLLISNVSPPL